MGTGYMPARHRMVSEFKMTKARVKMTLPCINLMYETALLREKVSQPLTSKRRPEHASVFSTTPDTICPVEDDDNPQNTSNNRCDSGIRNSGHTVIRNDIIKSFFSHLNKTMLLNVVQSGWMPERAQPAPAKSGCRR